LQRTGDRAYVDNVLPKDPNEEALVEDSDASDDDIDNDDENDDLDSDYDCADATHGANEEGEDVKTTE
jgi:hypothetical protein